MSRVRVEVGRVGLTDDHGFRVDLWHFREDGLAQKIATVAKPTRKKAIAHAASVLRQLTKALENQS